MDRTMIAGRKCEEKSFSEHICNKLEYLFVLYPPTHELRNVFVEDMFVKPNTKAFPHVMHFLFTILDPVEFKKRFYWPVFDKNTEATFRTASVQYLNFLNDRHNLGWGAIKNFILLMPGGLKFMSLLSDLIDFVVAEEIKRTKHNLGDEFPINTKLTKGVMLHFTEEHNNFIAKAMNNKLFIEGRESLVRQKIDKLKIHLSKISKLTDVPVSKLEDENFVSIFREMNKKFYTDSVKDKVCQIEALEKPVEQLEKFIIDMQSDKQEFPCNKEMLLDSYNEIAKYFPEECQQSILNKDDQINLESLLNAFNCILPLIEHELNECKLKSEEILDFEEEEMRKLKEEAIQLEHSFLRFENSTKCDKIATEESISAFDIKNSLHTKFVSTPPINFRNFEGDLITIRPRLPLLDDYANREKSFSSSNQTAIQMPKSTKKIDSFILGSANKSKIVDPITLLNTLTKKRRPDCTKIVKKNLSGLASKWKEKESMISNENNSPNKSQSQTIVCRRQESKTLFCDSPSSFSTLDKNETVRFDGNFTSCFSKAKKRILTEEIIETRTTMSPDSLIYQKTSRTDSVILLHEGYDNFDLRRASTSPSGRLQSIINFDEKLPPKVLLNDNIILIDPKTDNLTNKQDTTEESDEHVVTIKAFNNNVHSKDEATENNMNISNLNIEFCKKLNIDDGKDSIFDVSDTILNDVEM